MIVKGNSIPISFCIVDGSSMNFDCLLGRDSLSHSSINVKFRCNSFSVEPIDVSNEYEADLNLGNISPKQANSSKPIAY